MGSKWRECELGDFIELKRGYDLPKGSRVNGTIPIISSAGFSGLHNESKVSAPGVVTGRYGTIGEVFYVEQDFWPLNTTLYVTDFKGNDPLYVYYFLKTISYSDYVDKAAVPGINRNHLHKAKIKVPVCPKHQRELALQLYALDNKITLNRQINQTLEQMAQTLFKSWFVDFDPVIDNALDAGNDIPDTLQERAEQRRLLRVKADFKPLPAETRALFPSEFEETELGWVPKGWESANLGKYFAFNGGHPFKSGDYSATGQYGIVTIKNVQDGCFINDCANKIDFTPEKMKPYCKLVQGDILMSLTGNVARVCLVDFGNYLLNQRVAKLEGKNGCNNAFTYFFFRQQNIFDKLMTLAKGTAQLNLSPIESADVLHTFPNKHLIEYSNKLFDSYLSKIVSTSCQIQHLINLRDALLPKLISGELELDALPAVPELAEAR